MNNKIIDSLDDIFYSLKLNKIKDTYYYLRNRFFRKYYLIDTKLSKGQWHDTDQKILYGMMEVLVDFVEKEKPDEIVNWNSEPEHQHAHNEFTTIYKWWKDYPNRQKAIEDKLTEWYNASFPKDHKMFTELSNGYNQWNPGTKNELTEKLFSELNKLEEDLDNEEQDMLIRLIKIRKFLWT